jgi:hypothetical protein
MEKEIQKYPIYVLNKEGKLIRTYQINGTKDYNHYMCNLHHYIPFQEYEKNKKWYQEKGIEQKLILMSIPIHEQIHNQAIKILSDEEFKERYKISKWELIFNKKKSEY